MSFDFTLPVAFEPERKRRFHREARRRLRLLAAELNWPAESFDLRSNLAGVAVSGEVTLHHERGYVQVAQSSVSPAFGILFRRCNGRRDYTGGTNHFVPLALLDDLPALAERVREALGC